MKEVFFAGDIIKNNGPSNVNKELFRFLKNDFTFVNASNRWISLLMFIYYTLRCKVIVFSGLLKVDFICLKLAKILKKKIVYIMHGCVQYEQGEILKIHDSGMELENQLFAAADQILCVSVPFAEWFKEYKKEYSFKVEVLQNGIPWDSFSNSENNVYFEKPFETKKIVLVGGGRLTKMNINVAKAICKINEKSKAKWEIDLYGYYREDDDSSELMKYEFVNFCGMVSHDKLMEQFSKATLFVQNSIWEPFGLACIEAIMHNCNVLISRFVGSSTVMALEEDDVIIDPHNIDELVGKIEKFEKRTNYKRLTESIDKEQTSCKYSANKLKRIVEMISHGGMEDNDKED